MSRVAPRKREASDGLDLEAELRRAIVAISYMIIRDGPVYAPILERLERDLEDLRKREEPVEKARRLLAAYTDDEGGSDAIRSIQSNSG